MHDTCSRSMVLTVLALSVTLTGCKAKDTARSDSSSAMPSMAATDSSATATSSASNVAVAAPLSDANIAALVNEVNVADSTLAAAALPKLTNAGARSFAKLMMGEHHGLHVKGLQVEKAQNITPQLPATDPFKPAVGAEQSALSSAAKGATYDSTYIANEIGIHQAVIEWAGKNTPQNPALQDYMKSAVPVYQKHLDKARDLQAKLGGGQKS